ncbi:MAG: aldo/keto reductase [Clostridia bacterium]|nr:aldo/keto reductase [Clostridia bacterium]
MLNQTDTFTLSNGVRIPCIGFGTFRIPDGQICEEAVAAALHDGYRHIDTAAVYGNERSVGRAIAESGVDRSKIFLTSKVWNDHRSFDGTLRSFDATLHCLGTDYLDLYLIHWPSPRRPDNPDWNAINEDTWRALERLYEEGRVRAIGVSNFRRHHLEAMHTEIEPMLDQIEYHPGQTESTTVAYCREHGILIEAWSPLGSGSMFQSAVLRDIAGTYGKDVAQIIIRWCLQNDVLPLVRSTISAHIRSDLRVFDFALSNTDMRRIDAIPFFAGSGLDPDAVNF